MTLRLSHCLLVVTFLLYATVAVCQTTDGEITGRVVDSSNAVIPGASVAVINDGTNVTRSFLTDATGNYTAPGLAPGSYHIRVEKDGFNATIRPSIIVHVGDVLKANFVMRVGVASQSVTVSAGAALLQTESTTLGSVVDSREISNLPLVSRNYTQILALSPGVGAEVTNAAALGRNSQDVFVNGMGSAGNSFQMDGIEINNYASNSAGDSQLYGGIAIPNPDAIQEFKVQTSLYDAASGRSVGANVEVVTKSGTNDFHGTIFEFLRNDALNANDFFSNRTGQRRPVLRQNQFGGTFGGPPQRPG